MKIALSARVEKSLKRMKNLLRSLFGQDPKLIYKRKKCANGSVVPESLFVKGCFYSKKKTNMTILYRRRIVGLASYTRLYMVL